PFFCASTHSYSQQNDCRNRAAGLGVMQNTTMTERPACSSSNCLAETRRILFPAPAGDMI
ncbi:MAG: hypothetical protein K8H75_06280, partial [Sulfuricella sp.]|nr:hypothetical protein [Sulfuricella sp.]